VIAIKTLIHFSLYQNKATRRVSRITFSGYAQYRNIGKPNNLKVFGSNKPKGINWIAKIS